MKKTILSLCISLLIAIGGISQNYSFPANTYPDASNPYYWKNRPPFKGYWQQDIYYKIIASLDDSKDIISGDETLIYTNNSPDTLKNVYFHLYSNAQNKDSYYSNLSLNNGDHLKFGKYESEDSGCAVQSISIDDAPLKAELDNTVMKAYLNKPLLPGQNVTFHIHFRTFFDQGGNRNRMKMFIAWQNKSKDTTYKQYDVVHWYPRMCVYDTKFGWDVEQHLAHEFYGDFGCYDIAFTLPNNYVVGATGTLLNEKEMLPDSLMKKLDIKNYAHKRWGSAPSMVIPRNNTAKTWLFHAENVHDFALTADPTYRIGQAEWHGIKCYSMAEEMHAAGWQNAASYTASVIATNSKYFGMYGYPKMIVADARDGMEYPMLTLDGGFDPGYRTLLAHEVSHNWFFGMVGNNETYRAALDEGFTQFAESWTCQKLDGKYDIEYPPANKYVRKYTEPTVLRMEEVYDGYLYNNLFGIADFTDNMQGKSMALRGSGNYGFKDVTLNTHSDDFHGALGHGGGYGQVYFKTATMLYNLQYVLGDSLFFAAMQHYFNQWKFCHPYLNDFRNSITGFVHTDLTWFFDEWLNTAKTIDYGVKSIRKGKAKDEYIITFVRKGEMQMPIDFTVTSKADSVYNYYIPNSWFVKKTKATVLPRWIGWGKIEPTYEARVIIPDGISNVTIDTSLRLADINMLNNSKPFPFKFYFDSKIAKSPDWTNYEAFFGPSLWYNRYDGIKIGVHMHGDYMLFRHNLSATLFLNTGILQNEPSNYPNINGHQIMSFKISYQTPVEKFIPRSSVNLYAQSMDGVNVAKLLFQMKDNSMKYTFYSQLKTLYMPHYYDTSYLIYPQLWTPEAFNNSVTVGIKHDYKYSNSGKGYIDLSFKNALLTSDYNYSQVNLTIIETQQLGKKMTLHVRGFGQYATGNLPIESALYAAGANPEELMNNQITSSQGIIQESWASYGASENHFQEGGGLNLRGYAGYLLPEITANKELVYAYTGNSGAAINAELDFNHLVHFNPKFLRDDFALSTYLFGDAGIINITSPLQSPKLVQFSSIRADAGLGVALTIQRWGPLQLVKPLTLRFDMPLFLNEPPATDKDFVQWRWVFGIGRCF
jgi:aminopeptidase N